MAIPDEVRAIFEAEGESGVRQRVAQKIYGDKHIAYAQEWLQSKELHEQQQQTLMRLLKKTRNGMNVRSAS
jgi:hypothetical protein